MDISTDMHSLKQEADIYLEKHGLPDRKDEEYKYTPLSKLIEKEFDSVVETVDSLASGKIEKIIPGWKANRLVFINGQYRDDLSVIVDESGLVIERLDNSDQISQKEIEQYLGQLAEPTSDPFVALNTSAMTSGTVSKVEKGSVIEHPVHLMFISDSSQGKAKSQYRNLFIVGENAQVNFVESFHTIGDEISLSNSVTEIVVSKNSVTNYYKLQIENDGEVHVGTSSIKQLDTCVFNAATITLGGKMIRNNLNITMESERCEANLNGLYLVTGKSHVDNHTAVDHKYPNCNSNELYKGVLDENATGVFNGKIYVRPQAQQTNAFQSNKNILLSDSATINTKPQLEIWADDVKCSHGCTTGQLDDEQIFYLRSRGISKEKARALVLYAFAMEVIDNIKIEGLREYLDERIAERLG